MPGTVEYLKDKLVHAIDAEGNVSLQCTHNIPNRQCNFREIELFLKRVSRSRPPYCLLLSLPYSGS